MAFLFSRKNYDYQNRLANNKAKADRIEDIIKVIGSSIASLTIAIANSMEFIAKFTAIQNKALHMAINPNFTSNGTNAPQNEEYQKQQEKSQDFFVQESLKRTSKINEENTNWQVKATSISADFNSLNLTPLIPYMREITNRFAIALNYTSSGDINKFNEASNALNSIEPYRGIVLTVLLILANAARQGKEVACPSVKELRDFKDDPAQLNIWIEGVKKIKK